MSSDIKLRNACDHMVYREKLTINRDLMTAYISRPISNIQTLKVYLNGSLIERTNTKFGYSVILDNSFLDYEVDGSEDFRMDKISSVILQKKNIIISSISITEMLTDEPVPIEFFKIDTFENSLILRATDSFKEVLEGSIFRIYYKYELDSDDFVPSVLYKIKFNNFINLFDYSLEATYSTLSSSCRKCSGIDIINDVVFDSLGKLILVSEGNKLLQDCFIYTFTELNSDSIFPFIGTDITSLIGKPYIRYHSDLDFKTQISSSLGYLSNIQAEQIRFQEVTNSERLRKIESIYLEETEDPTIFNLHITVVSELGEDFQIDSILKFSRVI